MSGIDTRKYSKQSGIRHIMTALKSRVGELSCQQEVQTLVENIASLYRPDEFVVSDIVSVTTSDVINQCRNDKNRLLEQFLSRNSNTERWDHACADGQNNWMLTVKQIISSDTFADFIESIMETYKRVVTPYMPKGQKHDPRVSFWKSCKNVWWCYSLGLKSSTNTASWYFFLVVFFSVLVGVGDGIFARFLQALNFAVIESIKTGDLWPVERAILMLLAFNGLKIAIKALLNYYSYKMMIKMRQNITDVLQEMYCQNRTYYTMNELDGRVDNCDSRITADVDLMCQFNQEFIFGGIRQAESGLFWRIIAFVTLVFVCYNDFHDTIAQYSASDSVKSDPTFYCMVPVMVSVGTFLVSLFPILSSSKYLSRAQEDQQRSENDLRYSHSVIETHAESIAFYSGASSEQWVLGQKTKKVIANLQKFALVKGFVDFIQLFMFMGAKSVSPVITAVFILLIDVPASASSQVFQTLWQPLDIFIKNIMELTKAIVDMSKGMAFCNRVMYHLEVNQMFLLRDDMDISESSFKCVTRHRVPELPIASYGTISTSPHIILKSCNIYTPPGDRRLMSNVNLSLMKGESLLIMGPSGIGKSSLLRVLGKLWPLYCSPAGEGKNPELHRPCERNVFFMSQKPYIIDGTLREQMAYPVWGDELLLELTDQVIQFLCKLCGLESLFETHKDELDRPGVDWSSVLSLGEQQRLQFARLFWHYDWHCRNGDVDQGFFAVLDEATAALDKDTEAMVYRNVRDSGMGFCSVAHRPTVIQFHTKVMVLSTDEFMRVSYKLVSGSELAVSYAAKMRGIKEDEIEQRSSIQQFMARTSAPCQRREQLDLAAAVPPTLLVGNRHPDLLTNPLPKTTDAKTLMLDKMLQNQLNNATINPDDGYDDSDEDEQITYRRLARRIARNDEHFVDSPYAPVRDEEAKERLGAKSIRRLLLIFRIGMREVKSKATLFTCIALVFAVLSAAFEVQIMGVIKNIMKYVEEGLKEGSGITIWEAIFKCLQESLWYLLGVSFFKSTSNLISLNCMIQFRRNILNTLHGMYCEDRAKLFLILNSLDKRVDNPAQRITQDLDLAMQHNCDFFLGGILQPDGGLINNVFLFIFCCSWISTEFASNTKIDPLVAGTMSIWMIPVCIGIFLLAAIPSTIMSRRVTNVSERQQEYEAEFRSAHLRMQTNCEAIAFYGGDSTEHTILTRRFAPVWKNMHLYSKRKFGLDCSTLTFYYATHTFTNASAAFITVFCLMGSATVTDQYIGIFFAIILQAIKKSFDALRNISSRSLDLAIGSAYVKRVLKCMEVMQEFHLLEENNHPDRLEVVAQSFPDNGGCCGPQLRSLQTGDYGKHIYDDFVEFKNVDVYTPNGTRFLLGNINLKIEPGKACIIMGPSGIGKSSLLRVLGGLWPMFRSREGLGCNPVLTRPKDNIFFLAQKPYMTEGTLMEQVAYPIWEQSVLDELTEDKMRELFETCNLSSVWRTRKKDLHRPGVNWGETLSLGEQQRLQFCRLFWHFEWTKKHRNSPNFFAILDEATAALDTESEMIVHQAVRDRGIGMLSVAHRPTVIQYHDHCLRFNVDKRTQEVKYKILPTSDILGEVAAAMTNDLEKPKQNSLRNLRSRSFSSQTQLERQANPELETTRQHKKKWVLPALA